MMMKVMMTMMVMVMGAASGWTNVKVLGVNLAVLGLVEVLLCDEDSLTEEVLVDCLAVGLRNQPGREVRRLFADRSHGRATGSHILTIDLLLVSTWNLGDADVPSAGRKKRSRFGAHPPDEYPHAAGECVSWLGAEFCRPLRSWLRCTVLCCTASYGLCAVLYCVCIVDGLDLPRGPCHLLSTDKYRAEGQAVGDQL